MFKGRTFLNSLWLVLLSTFLFSGCAYTLKYKLDEQNITRANSPSPLKIQVATFSDERNIAEKEKSARKDQGFNDAGDYTYDKQFKGAIAEEISKMLVSHLDYSGSFSDIELSQHSSTQISAEVLDQLETQGVDAVLTGTIESFYGYYDQNPGKQLLYSGGLALAFGIPVAIATTGTETKDVGFARFEETTTNPVAIALAVSLGGSLGNYIESTGQRSTEGHTKLSAKLLSASSTHEVIWEDVVEINRKKFRSMPGLNTQKRKFELAVGSLRDAVNEMVQSISASVLITKKN